MTLLQMMRRIDRALFGDGQQRRVLVDSRTPVNFEMVAPVVRMMAPDARVRFCFTASEEPEALVHVYRDAPTGTQLIGPRLAALSQWDVYLTSDFMWATLLRGAVRIQMFHGVAGKYGFDAPRESMRMWDRLFFVNERRLRNFVACGAIDADSPAARVIGMPKVDCLVDGSLPRDATVARFGLDPSRPTALYAPTWSSASSLNVMGETLIERLLSTLPLNLIVKLHDRSCDIRPRYSGGIDWRARIEPLLARFNGARQRAVLAAGADVTPCLAAADLLITDHSSAGFEYLLLDRPVIRIEIPELLKQARVHPDYVQLLAEASLNVTTVQEAVNAAEQAVACPQKGSASRRAVAGGLFYKPGTATARCAAALYEVLELPAPTPVDVAADVQTSVQSA